ncbi:MAG TPA: sialidase family protein [Streptosporangiaceae bacterium]|nr:sialidase family protein [Streptosporangiaceae bacterium]
MAYTGPLARARAVAGCVALALASPALTATAAAPPGVLAASRSHTLAMQRPQVGPVTEVSRGCKGQNAEVEQAVALPYVYEAWIGCGGIGFARSTNGGRSFGRPVTVPGSTGSGFVQIDGRFLPKYGWDPAIAVAPNGTVYVSYMIFRQRQGYDHPRVAVSTDHGATFAHLYSPMPPAQDRDNWGDRDFITVAPDGKLYLTWDFGPSLKSPDANIVIQDSADGGRVWSRITPVSPGYPAHGGVVAGPLVVEPNGRIDVLLWVLHDPGLPGYALPPGHDYFTSSPDGGRSWSKPVAVGPKTDHIGGLVGWIDADIGIDAAGTLYATWDTQRPGGDIGWLSYSTDHGQTWSRARRATPDHDKAEHIMAVVGGAPGDAYVGWLSDNSPAGFAQYLRPFSVRKGWLSAPIQVSRQFGDRRVWPGDTIGISLLRMHGHSPPTVMLSWGSAVSKRTSQIWAVQVRHA